MTRNEYQRARRAMLKALGRCVLCGKPAPSGYTTCAACRDKISRQQALRRHKRVVDGCCPNCGAPLDADYEKVCCPSCLERAKLNYMKRGN